MSEYLIREESLTAIAQEVRDLVGLEDLLSPSAMSDNLASANDEIRIQRTLIQTLADNLQGKAITGEGMQTCSVDFYTYGGSCYVYTTNVNADGTISAKCTQVTDADSSVVIGDVLCGSMLYYHADNNVDYSFTISGCSVIFGGAGVKAFCITASDGETVTIQSHPM